MAETIIMLNHVDSIVPTDDGSGGCTINLINDNDKHQAIYVSYENAIVINGDKLSICA